MPKQDEITSTEKLLKLIRSKSDAPTQPSPQGVAGASRKKQKAKPPRKTQRMAVTLGADVGRREIRLALMGRAADKKPLLIQHGRFPYGPDLTSDSPQFPVFLKKTIQDFCNGYRKVSVWCTIPSTNVEIRFLRIPKVAKKQVANTMFWTHKRETGFDEKESVFDFEMLGESMEGGTQRMEAIAYTASRAEIEAQRRLFAKTGFSLTGISIVPFAQQNLFRTGWSETRGQNVCTLFIGTDWSRIAIFAEKNLVLSRDIKAGLQSMIEAIADELEKIYPDFSMPLEQEEELTLAGDGTEITSPFHEQAQKILYGFINDDLAAVETETGVNLTEQDVVQMITPALDRVIRQVERTLDHYYLNYHGERVKKVYLTGPICSHERLVGYIGEQLGLAVDFIDPFSSDLTCEENGSCPETMQERGAYLPAIGMALADNAHTPNFIYTYRDKEKVDGIARFNRSIFGVSIVLMIVCMGYFAWQNGRLDKKKDQVVKLQRQLEAFIPRVDQNMILQLASYSFSDRQSVDAFAEKYKGMAIISEITRMTPPNIRLARMAVELGGLRKEKGPDAPRIVVLEGIVSGDRLNFESDLAGYMVKLERSPLFGRPEILGRTFEVYEEQSILKFQAQIEVM